MLEIGCGDGDLTVMLAKRGATVTAIDLSSEMIEAARVRAAREGAESDFHVGTARSLPFAAEQFDIVIAVAVLCFVSDATAIYKEIARVIRPGGRLVDGEVGKWSSWAAARRIQSFLGSALWRRGRFRSPGDLRWLARGAGLIPGSVRGAVDCPKWNAAARLMAPLDAFFGRVTNFGASFLSLTAVKPIGCEGHSGRPDAVAPIGTRRIWT